MRCIERLGYVLDEKPIIEAIKSNKLEFYERDSNRITKWIYEKDDKKYIVVYDKERHQLVTILNYIERSKDGN